MRIQFTGSVSVLGGPRYHAGEIVETDPHVLTDEKARRYVMGGWAVEVAMADPKLQPAQKPAVPLPTKDIKAPPVDKMVKGAPVRK